MPEGEQPKSRSTTAELAGQVLRLLEPELTADGFELLDVRIFQGGGRFQVRVYVDLEEGGITLDRCTQAARTVNMLLEEADLFPGQYVIEVSSPGIRRPLRTPSHFTSAVGQKVELKLKSGQERTRLRGLLQEVQGSVLHIVPAAPKDAEQEPEPVAVDLDQVAEANLDPEFDAKALINADRRRRKEDRRAERQARKKKGRKVRPKSGRKAGGPQAGDDDTTG